MPNRLMTVVCPPGSVTTPQMMREDCSVCVCVCVCVCVRVCVCVGGGGGRDRLKVIQRNHSYKNLRKQSYVYKKLTNITRRLTEEK